LTTTRWKVRVGVEAENDFVRILKYTADTFGERQASKYKAKLTDAKRRLNPAPTREEVSLATKSYPISAASTSHATAEEGDISSCIASQRDRGRAHSP
jgi:plasmid stabilization system protein ParE